MPELAVIVTKMPSRNQNFRDQKNQKSKNFRVKKLPELAVFVTKMPTELNIFETKKIQSQKIPESKIFHN